MIYNVISKSNYYFQNCQKHIKLGLGELFSDLLIQSNGIQTFLRVACDLISETSQNFNHHGLEEWSNLIHSYYLKSKEKYTNYIVPQVNNTMIIL